MLEAIDTRVVLEPRESVFLNRTEGSVEPYHDYSLPHILRMPLKVSSQGIMGLDSNGRSVLLLGDGKWFKYKGARPSTRQYAYSDEPAGGMSSQKSKNELEKNEKIAKKYQEYGFKPPLIPAADVEYDIPFKGGKVHAAIQECNGDTRLDTVEKFIEKKLISKEMSIDSKILKEFSSKVSSWAGFSNRTLHEAGVLPSRDSNMMESWVLHDVGNGFGVGRVDHGSSTGNKDETLIKELNEGLKRRISNITISPVFLELSEKLKTSVWDLIMKRWFEIEYLKEKSRERVDYRNSVVYALRDRFDLCDELNKKYYSFLENNKVPNPIEKSLVFKLFT